VWEDDGTADQAIAGLLHDEIEDAGQSHGSIAGRLGVEVADIVATARIPASRHQHREPRSVSGGTSPLAARGSEHLRQQIRRGPLTLNRGL
jgi:hypothetical protein